MKSKPRGGKPRKTDVTIRDHRYRTLLAAEEFAKAHRAFVGQAVCSQTQAQYDKLKELFFKWHRMAGKRGFEEPKDWPASGPSPMELARRLQSNE